MPERIRLIEVALQDDAPELELGDLLLRLSDDEEEGEPLGTVRALVVPANSSDYVATGPIVQVAPEQPIPGTFGRTTQYMDPAEYGEAGS